MKVKIKSVLQRPQLGSPIFSKGRKFSRVTENDGVCDGVDFALKPGMTPDYLGLSSDGLLDE